MKYSKSINGFECFGPDFRFNKPYHVIANFCVINEEFYWISILCSQREHLSCRNSRGNKRCVYYKKSHRQCKSELFSSLEVNVLPLDGFIDD